MKVSSTHLGEFTVKNKMHKDDEPLIYNGSSLLYPCSGEKTKRRVIGWIHLKSTSLSASITYSIGAGSSGYRHIGVSYSIISFWTNYVPTHTPYRNGGKVLIGTLVSVLLNSQTK